jgi:hypothetical protein
MKSQIEPYGHKLGFQDIDTKYACRPLLQAVPALVQLMKHFASPSTYTSTPPSPKQHTPSAQTTRATPHKVPSQSSTVISPKSAEFPQTQDYSRYNSVAQRRTAARRRGCRCDRETSGQFWIRGASATDQRCWHCGSFVGMCMLRLAGLRVRSMGFEC